MAQSSDSSEIVLQGVPASPGVSHGKAFVFLKKDLEIPAYTVAEEKREEEITRFEQGLMETRRQISAIRAEIEERLGEEEAQIFDAHQLVLEDRALIEETIREVVETGYNIEHCFHHVARRYIEAFSNIDDDYIKERVSDIRDVSRRLLNNLLGKSDISLATLNGQRVIVSDDLSPSDTANVDKSKVLGLVTDQGSRTSHAVIMARTIDVPAVVGLRDVSSKLKSGDDILVDGYDGVVIINPTEKSLFRYGRIRLERQNIQKLFRSATHLPSETKDRQRLSVMLNVEGMEKDEDLRGSGAEGVGLFRTETLFLRGSRFPSEEEQYRAYRRVAEAVKPHATIIRTLDLGGDKNPHAGLFGYEEANPFMGFRAIRFCLEQVDVFKAQLRAILRAAVHGPIKMMYPMISSVYELEQANEVFAQCKEELSKEGIAYDPNIEVGSMIEIPSAACTVDLLAQHCSFFSIGTNDLIQYLLAVDRVNDRIAHLYEPNHPAVMRMLEHIIKQANEHNTPVGVCGEMAGDPLYAALLFGLGANSVSIAATSIPEVKYFIRAMKLAEAQDMAKEAVTLKTPKAVLGLLQSYYRSCIGSDIMKKF